MPFLPEEIRERKKALGLAVGLVGGGSVEVRWDFSLVDFEVVKFITSEIRGALEAEEEEEERGSSLFRFFASFSCACGAGSGAKRSGADISVSASLMVTHGHSASLVVIRRHSASPRRSPSSPSTPPP